MAGKIIKKRAKKAVKSVNFWKKINKPFFALAPMANVTDAAFRSVIAKYGRPQVMWTEFVSADGLCSSGKKRLLYDLNFSKKEKPIVAQLFSSNPESIKKAAVIVTKLGFDGIDINMGCPDRAVEKQGSGAALMKNKDLAISIIESAQGATLIPISVKTRIGYSKFDADWLRSLLQMKLPALTVHLRTRKEMSEVNAHWELMPEIVKMRDEISPETLIIGNGDVTSIEDGLEMMKRTGCDGVMIGRGIFGKPWLFSGKIIVEPRQRLKIMLEHAKLFNKYFCGKIRIKSFDVMKKHFKAYVSGWDGAKELRIKLMETKGYDEVESVVKEYL